jgi:hypothetical protein
MKYFYGLFILIAACTVSQQPSENKDSITTIIPSDTTGADTTTYDLTEDEYDEMQNAGAAGFSLSGTTGSGTLLDTDIVEIIRQGYSPDNLLPEDGEQEPVYTITSSEGIEGDFITLSGNCAQGAALFCTQSKSQGEEEEYNLFFVSKKNGRIVVDGPQVFTGSYAQTSASASVTLEYKLSDNCPALAVESGSEGGDIDLSRDAAVTFYILDEQDVFYEVLQLVTEETRVSEYEVTGDENKNSSSETRSFEILQTKSNGLRDIKTHFISKTNGEIVQEEDELYRFDGKKYVEQIN